MRTMLCAALRPAAACQHVHGQDPLRDAMGFNARAAFLEERKWKWNSLLQGKYIAERPPESLKQDVLWKVQDKVGTAWLLDAF